MESFSDANNLGQNFYNTICNNFLDLDHYYFGITNKVPAYVDMIFLYQVLPSYFVLYSIQFFIIYVLSQQPQDQLQTQHSTDIHNYIMDTHNIKSRVNCRST
jgi:hypothetical protein